MQTRFRRRRGAPRRRVSFAHVLGALALILVVGGGSAWAASITHKPKTKPKHHYIITSTGQIKPSVLKSLHGAKGTNGTNGTNGANGATGPTGATGATGATGTTGFTSTLPSGKTEVGTWAANVGATTSVPYYIPISFEIPLTAAPTVNTVAVGGPPTGACPGTVGAPTAASGNVCFYEAHLSAGTTVSAFNPNADGGNPGFGAYGGVLFLSTASTGYAYGTWAVTG